MPVSDSIGQLTVMAFAKVPFNGHESWRREREGLHEKGFLIFQESLTEADAQKWADRIREENPALKITATWTGDREL